MSLNRSLLTQISEDLKKKKKPSKPGVPRNQWQHPGEVTNIPSSNITMDGVSYPVLGVPNVGPAQMMYPDQQYNYPDASNVTEYPMMASGGYTVTRSSDRKGKTHKVTGPDGTVKFFGDSKLGQHPGDPERKKAFYARHKKNLAGNPYFRAFARATWAEGGEVEFPEMPKMQFAGAVGASAVVQNINKPKTPQELAAHRQRMYNTIRPSDYYDQNNYMRFMFNNQREEMDDVRSEEGFRQYLGLNTKPKFITPAVYRPTQAKNPNAKYYKVDKQLEQDLFDSFHDKVKMGQTMGTDEFQVVNNIPYIKRLDDQGLYNEEDNSYYLTKTDQKLKRTEYQSRARVLGNFTVSHGKDDKGEYLSYYDTYDFPGLVQKQMQGSPYELYGRMYYPKKAIGGQTRDEREMVNGIADILTQVKDVDNREQIARQMMADFERDNVTYDAAKFKQMSKLKHGGWLDQYQEGGPTEYTGSSVVDYLQTKGFSGSKKFRKQLAEEMGIEGYNYSAAKNLELLGKLREQDSLPEGYEQEFTPRSAQEMVELEKQRGVYAPAPAETAPVVSRPVSGKFRIPMAADPNRPYAGMFDPRVALNSVPAAKPTPAKANPFFATPKTGFPGMWNQQDAMQRIKNYVPPVVAKKTPAPTKADSFSVTTPVGFPGMWNQSDATKRIQNYTPAGPVKKIPAARKSAAPHEVVPEAQTEQEAVAFAYTPSGMAPFMGTSVSSAALETVADDIQGLWEKATNWWDRNSAMGDGKQERKASIDPKKIANDPIYVTGDTIPDAHGRYHIPEVMDLNYLKFGTRNRGEYTPIDTEAGSITAFKPFESAKDYFAKNNDPANSTYMGVGPDGKIKVGGRKDFEGQDFRISKTFSNKIVDFNRNPDGSIVKVKSNPKASKETFSPSVKVMGDDGKVIDGKMSLLLPKNGNQEESFDLVTGGRYIMQTPDGKLKMVSGSLKNIESEFKKLKDGNPYVNVITLDNGSYSRGIRTYNQKLTKKDLKRYDNQNTEGGNFAYLLPNAPKTRYDLKFNEFETTAKQRLQQLYPGKKVEVRFENEGLYDARGSRDITSQAAIQKKGYSQTPVSMHNFDAARDYALFVDGKKIPADKQKDLYKKVLWGAADKVGMYHLDDWDAVHIGLVKEGEKTGFNELYAKYPDIFATANTKKTKAFLEKNKNNPVYKEAYELLNNIKPFVPKTPKKQNGGNWLEKYN